MGTVETHTLELKGKRFRLEVYRPRIVLKVGDVLVKNALVVPIAVVVDDGRDCLLVSIGAAGGYAVVGIVARPVVGTQVMVACYKYKRYACRLGYLSRSVEKVGVRTAAAVVALV